MENGGAILPKFTWCVANLVHPTTITFPCESAKCFWPNMTSDTLYVKSIPTTWRDMKKKRIWNAHNVFYVQTKIPLWKAVVWVIVYKMCMLWMLRCADTILLWKWLKMDVGKSNIVWSGNTGFHMSPWNVINFRVA